MIIAVFLVPGSTGAHTCVGGDTNTDLVKALWALPLAGLASTRPQQYSALAFTELAAILEGFRIFSRKKPRTYRIFGEFGGSLAWEAALQSEAEAPNVPSPITAGQIHTRIPLIRTFLLSTRAGI